MIFPVAPAPLPCTRQQQRHNHTTCSPIFPLQDGLTNLIRLDLSFNSLTNVSLPGGLTNLSLSRAIDSPISTCRTTLLRWFSLTSTTINSPVSPFPRTRQT